ncbi:hypothetical protein [Granulicella tundricola]|nr:hypothetical protein [Granulicella tundricola]
MSESILIAAAVAAYCVLAACDKYQQRRRPRQVVSRIHIKDSKNDPSLKG